MTKTEDDLGLETLLRIREAQAPNLDADLLRQCYLIQRKHQFNADGDEASSAMERLIDEAVKEKQSCQ